LRVLLELLTWPEPQPGGLLLQELPSPLPLGKTQLLACCGKRSVVLDDTGSMDLGGHGERERFEKEQGLWLRNAYCEGGFWLFDWEILIRPWVGRESRRTRYRTDRML